MQIIDKFCYFKDFGCLKKDGDGDGFYFIFLIFYFVIG
jgi:hypothetical protein